MSLSSDKPASPRRPRIFWLLLTTVLASGGLGYAAWRLARTPRLELSPPAETLSYARSRFFPFGRFGFWWGAPEHIHPLVFHTGNYSNIEPDDYVGAETCARCHQANYKSWSQHPHRWMTAGPTPDHVLGDFSGQGRFRYLGGQGRFWREDDRFCMAAERGPCKRVFRITRTLGSRYFQYYIGVQIAGPEPREDLRYQVNHVLPFGYWLKERQWVPTVHLGIHRVEDCDDVNADPYEHWAFTDYDRSCSQCHTTLPMGDWLLRSPYEAGNYAPRPLSLDLSGYLSRQRRTSLAEAPERVSDVEVDHLLKDLVENRVKERILRLGIECEACHNGGKRHAADPEHTPPYFFPTSPLIYAAATPSPSSNRGGSAKDWEPLYGRTRENLNWICARCHNGDRPLFPGGISTWNSVESTDAMRGSCYSRLRCIDCHEPHRATGLAWSHSAEHDDRKCLKCHEQYRAAAARGQHTHHAAGSEGDRCMNCHMPRINEGLDRLVRTHTIFSPTKTAPIEQNGPNACNLCHLDRPIDWTLRYLRDWYGRRYDDGEIARNYPNRDGAVGLGWLRHPFQATRLVAAATYGQQQRKDALPDVLDILDDPFLLNRQFAQMAIEEICGQPLEKWGYRFTHSPPERAAVLPHVRAALISKGKKSWE